MAEKSGLSRRRHSTERAVAIDAFNELLAYICNSAYHPENVVIPTFLEVFRQYGLPKSILSDNGAQFSGFKQSCTQFERLLTELDILPIFGRIRHPQAQCKIEHFYRTMNQELL